MNFEGEISANLKGFLFLFPFPLLSPPPFLTFPPFSPPFLLSLPFPSPHRLAQRRTDLFGEEELEIGQAVGEDKTLLALQKEVEKVIYANKYKSQIIKLIIMIIIIIMMMMMF